MREQEIKQFAKHYDIDLATARDVCQRGGNWAAAFELLVKLYKAEPVQ